MQLSTHAEERRDGRRKDWLEIRLEDWGLDESNNQTGLGFPNISPEYRAWQVRIDNPKADGVYTALGKQTRIFVPNIPRYFCKHRISETRKAIESLSRPHQKALRARYVENDSGKTLEIKDAKNIGWTPRNYTKNLSEARLELKKMLRN